MAQRKSAATHGHGHAQARAQARAPQGGAAGEGGLDMRTVIESNGAAIHAAMKASEAMFEGMTELNKEVMSFASDRLHKGLQTSGSLMACHDPAEALNLQFEHARNATQAYLDEASRLMNLAARMSDQCLRSMETQTREALHRAGKNE